ncbi:kinase-like domain-containing protein [Nemania sp. FL0031]|nr:kinase-like domain-containing protein [Nemania sp. FL0031]
MEVHKARPLFVPDNGRIRFIYTRVLFSQDGEMFTGHSPNIDAESESELRIEELTDVKHIPQDAYSPLIPPGSTIAPLLPVDQCYIKRPDLFSLTVDLSHPNPILQELVVCELIRRHPHPNIATYHGCESTNGRVTGLVFERYAVTLLDKLNPGALNKSMFITSSDRAVTNKLADRCMLGIEAGLRHLHALGLVHNDLNPNNIMISKDGRPVIIDFDSCRAFGADLGLVKRTYEWYNPDVHVSVKTNDLDALAEIRVWLTSSTPEGYRFGG